MLILYMVSLLFAEPAFVLIEVLLIIWNATYIAQTRVAG